MRIKVIVFFFFLSSSIGYASKVDTLVVESASMHKAIYNIVITPDSYADQKEPYSVLYLLHGAGGSYTS